MKKEKLDAVEGAVEERRNARAFDQERQKELKAAKEQYDKAVASAEASAKRLEKAERTLSKLIEGGE